MSRNDSVSTTVCGIEASIEGPPGIEAVRQAHGVTIVWLHWSGVTDDDLLVIARLPDIRVLHLGDLNPTARQFAILAKLPPGAFVKLHTQEDYPEWAAFRRRRIAQIARLDPGGRRRAATRFARGINENAGWVDSRRSLRIMDNDAHDEDLRILGWLPLLREITFSQAWGLSTAGLRHISRLKRLKSLRLHGIRFTSALRPLARCTALETLEIHPAADTPADDSHTEGLERLGNLRRLELNGGRCASATVERIGQLAQLRYLDLTLGDPVDPDCLRALGGLRRLESLRIDASWPDESLRYIVGLKRLRELRIRLTSGQGEGFRHLADFGSLRHLDLAGEAVTDVAIRHLDGLLGLRSLRLSDERVTEAAARQLVTKIPGLTIRWRRKVVRAAERQIQFRRVEMDGFASALIPRRWEQIDQGDASRLTWLEEGFDGFGPDRWYVGDEAWPAQITLQIDDRPAATNARDVLHELMPGRSPLGPFSESRRDLEIAAFRRNGDQYVMAVAVVGRRAAILTCKAPPGRLQGLRGLFQFVAASLEVDSRSEVREVVVEARELA